LAAAARGAASSRPPEAAIVNYGHLEVSPAGSAFLLAERIENHGEVRAHEGEIGLYAGREVLLSDRPDGRGLSARVRLPAGAVDNTGRLVADGGAVALAAAVVNQGGVLEADTVRERGGVIELVAAAELNLDRTSRIRAGGGEAGPAAGGTVTLVSAGGFQDQAGSEISVAGAAAGGAGGEVHLSAPRMAAVHSRLDAAGHAGAPGGRLLLDPTDIVISAAGTASTGDGTVEAGEPPETLRLGTDTAFVGFSQITLQAARDVSVEGMWNLNTSTGVSAPGSRLTLQAGRDIRVKRGASVVAGENWSVQFEAGYDFARQTVQSGLGGIYFETGTFGTGGSLESRNGSIRLTAGKEVIVTTGFVRTTGGGDLEVQTRSGNVNTGSRPNGFVFSAQGEGYQVDPLGLGGISTAAGGNVTIIAGGDVKSLLPANSSNAHGDGGSGAFGAQPGDVTIRAGGDVVGHFLLRNGTGRIEAGRNAGLTSLGLALSLVKGSWTVNAQDIAMQEVRNPNGVFNRAGSLSAPTRHGFDYDPAAAVFLNARHGLQLVGLALPRNPGEESLPVLYPPRLELTAGAGGVSLGNNVTLFPSASGGLSLRTTSGGSLVSSTPGKSRNLVMSDSDRRRYTAGGDFGPFDHGATLLHWDNPAPLTVEVSGDVRDVLLALPKSTRMSVGGDMADSSLVAQNLSPADRTELVVQGSLSYRNEYTFLFPKTPPLYLPDPRAPEPSRARMLFPVLEYAVDQPGLQRVSDLVSRFYFNPTTGRLGFYRRMTEGELQALSNIRIRQFGENGGVIVDDLGYPVTVPAVFLPSADLQALFAASQGIPSDFAEGYQVGGPGTMRLEAARVDLGFSKGLLSAGPKYVPALAQVATRGADLEIAVSGDLTMFSSAIRCVNGGDIDIAAGGEVVVGDADLSFSQETARGIYTVGAADVTIRAGGSVKVGGSRIAAYDDGDVAITAEHGDVDAGVGGLGYVRVERIAVDPGTREITYALRAIPGSGILATSFPGTTDGVGDITVATPEGDIRANQGGIIQLSLNGQDARNSRISLQAGTRTMDGDGNPVVAHRGSIQAGESGVIGANVRLEATGDISGVVVAQQDIDVSSLQNVTVTAVASGSVSVSAGGDVAGTIVGIGGISVGGDNVSAALISDTVSASGNVTSAVGFSEVSVATASAQRMDTEKEGETVAKGTAGAKTADEEEQAAPRPVLARTVGRVTVVLPGR
jgi:hypothetical protein